MRTGNRAAVCGAIALVSLLVCCGGERREHAAPRPLPSAAPPAPTSSVDASAAWLRDNARPIRLPAFDDNDFSDLAPLAALIGESRIVALGEQTHGDGTTFRMKARLVRFLHENLGFDVLAVEEPLIDCDYADAQLTAGNADAATVKLCFAAPWGDTEELQPLLAYLAAKRAGSRPLELAGFDDMPHRRSIEFLQAAFERDNVRPRMPTEDWDAVQTMVFALRDQKRDELRHLIPEGRKILNRARESLRTHSPALRAELLAHVLDGIETGIKIYGDPLFNPAEDAGPNRDPTKNLRDIEMAENARWLIERRYPGKKIVLWAASFHLLRSHATIAPTPDVSYRGLVTMGERLAEYVNPPPFTLAFIAHDGQFLNRGTGIESIPPHGEDSAEGRLAAAGAENALLDLHVTAPGATWIHQPFVAGPLGYAFMRARWDEAFDAFLFTRRMAPITLVSGAHGIPADAGPSASDSGSRPRK